MRFVDASVFVHAFVRVKRPLRAHEARIKESAKRIVARIAGGEGVGMTVVQVAEVANLLESHLPLDKAHAVVDFLLNSGNVAVYGILDEDAEESFGIAVKNAIGLSDAICCRAMLKSGIAEIYSFDSDFDRLAGIRRIDL